MAQTSRLRAVALFEYTPKPGRLIMPDVRCDLVWGRGGLTLTGPQTRVRPSRHVGTDVTLLQLEAAVVHEWIRIPITQLTDRIVDVADIDPPQAQALNALYERGRLADLLSATGAAPAPGDIQVAAAAAMLRRGRRVSEVAAQVGLSERQLERRFAERTGLSPKTFARIVRFGSAVGHVKNGASFATAALAAGYADQAHFSRECSTLAGASPRAIIEHVGNVQELTAAVP
jgi:AraC-like DNA-binding protein